MSACKTIEPMLSAYIDNELDIASHEEIKRHLATCGACQHTHKQLVDIKREVGETALLTPSEAVDAKVLNIFRIQNRRFYSTWRVSIAASVVLVSLLLLLPMDNQIENETKFAFAQDLESAGKPVLSVEEFNKWTGIESDVQFACIASC